VLADQSLRLISALVAVAGHEHLWCTAWGKGVKTGRNGKIKNEGDCEGIDRA
jgi:hypothetical protein